MEDIKVIDTTEENIHNFGMCGYKNLKQEGYKRKLDWVKDRFREGMKYKMLYSESLGSLGGIEYIPGQYAWRPVDAAGYMFIHCIFVVPKKIKQKGFGTILVKSCEEDATLLSMKGVAVVTRKGTWMAGDSLFLKNGYEVIDEAKPDFQLVTKKFQKNAENPKFRNGLNERLAQYNSGLTIISSDQCPYTYKAITEISETAKTDYGIIPQIIELKSAEEAQNSPCVFGTFCMIFNGVIVADHPVSNTRFKNIMSTVLKN